MNFYPHHIGDYAKDTAHLTMIEDGAYRRLIDLYYTRERPLPNDLPTIYRLARAHTKQERAAVDVVLREFFVEKEFGFQHTRCEKEIANAQARISAAQQNGKRGGRPKKQGFPGDTGGDLENPVGFEEIPGGFSVGFENETQQKAHQSHTPITNPNTQEPDDGRARIAPHGRGRRAPLSTRPPTFEDVHAAFMANEAGYLSADQDAPELYDYYAAQGWTRKNGAQIFSLENLVADWIGRKEVPQ